MGGRQQGCNNRQDKKKVKIKIEKKAACEKYFHR